MEGMVAPWRGASVSKGGNMVLEWLAAVLPVGVFVTDTAGRCTWLSARCAEMCHLSAADALGHPWTDLVAPEGRDELARSWAEAASAGDEWQAEVRIGREGKRRWALCRTAPLPPGEDGAMGHVGTIGDASCHERDQVLLAGGREAVSLIAEGAPLADVLDSLTAMVEEQSDDGALASILLVTEDGKTLGKGSAPSLPEAYSRAIEGLEIGPSAGSCGTAAYRDEPVVVADIATDPLWAPWRELALSHGLRACWSTPIRSAEGEVLGTFATYYHQPRPPGSTDQHLVDQVTRTAAVAISAERSRRAAADGLARSRRLQDLAGRLAGARQTDSVARTSADYAMTAVGGKAAWLAMLDPKAASLDLACAPGFASEVRSRFGRVALDAPLPLAVAARTGRPRWTESEAQVLAELPLFAQGRPGAGSVAILPLVAGEHLVGVMGICRDRPGRFSPDEQAEAMAVAAQCAQALHRARRYEGEHQVSATLQQSLLTDPVAPDHLQVAARYRPASGGMEVGGDWYDSFVLPDGCLGIAIGDVVGHDLVATAAMGQLRSALRSLACYTGQGPGVVLAGVDELVERLSITDFATAVLAKVEGPRGGPHRLRWTNAGHPPPLLVLADGRTEALGQAPSPPLGLGAGLPREESLHDLPPAPRCCSTPTGWWRRGATRSTSASPPWQSTSGASPRCLSARSATRCWGSGEGARTTWRSWGCGSPRTRSDAAGLAAGALLEQRPPA